MPGDQGTGKQLTTAGSRKRSDAAASETPLRLALKRARSAFIIVALFSLTLNLMMLASPLYMTQIYRRVLTSGETSTLLFLTLIALFAIAILGALEAVRNWSLNRISKWLGATVSPALIESSVTASLAGAGRGGQALRDLGAIQQFVGGQGVTALMDSPWVPIFVVVIWFIHPVLGMLALGSAVILFALALLNELLTKRPLTEGNRSQMAAQQFVETSLRNAEIVQAMGMLPSLIARWRAHNDEASRRQLSAGDRGGAISGFTKFFRLAVQICILGAGALLVLAGDLGAGQMIATSILLSRALAPVEQSIGAWRNFTAARNAHARLEQLLRMAPPSKGNSTKLPAPRGELLADKVTFFPANSEHPILRNVSLALLPGETLGILGPSGAGKSTLCRLMVGVWKPQSGTVRLDWRMSIAGSGPTSAAISAICPRTSNCSTARSARTSRGWATPLTKTWSKRHSSPVSMT